MAILVKTRTNKHMYISISINLHISLKAKINPKSCQTTKCATRSISDAVKIFRNVFINTITNNSSIVVFSGQMVIWL